VKRPGLIAAVAVAALALPAAASAHAVLVKTVPQASGTVNTPPKQLALTFSEAVEPRFAIVSVTDAAGRQQTAGPPHRSQVNPDTLLVPLQRTAEGWYLVYWRVISVDGHPVRGAYTFAVGPNAGPAPQFVIPSISETAATPKLIVARWITFLSVMTAIGLLALRLAIARPMVRRVSGTSLRNVSAAFFVASAVGLVAIPVYLLVATADFALRSVFSIGALLPLVHASAFGRGYLDLELCFALFVAAGSAAIWVDRPEREHRSVAELLAFTGAAAAAAATLLVPGASGHPAQTSPRGIALMLDWLHLASGSVWIGGLIGLLVLWRSLPVAKRVAGLVVAVPRFSAVALVSVLVLAGSGTWASILHLPTLASLWQTSYGQAILVKVALLLAAIALAAVNLLRTKPGLQTEGPGAGGAAVLLRRLIAGEVLIVSSAVLVAAVLSSLAPPSKALAAVSGSTKRVGPGPVVSTIEQDGYKLQVRVAPNRAAVPNDFSVKLTRAGQPVRGADVVVRFDMLDMTMGEQLYRMQETSPGVYTRAATPALVMVGHWGLSFDVTPKGGPPLDVQVVDHATG
jgi:copper transport protein